MQDLFLASGVTLFIKLIISSFRRDLKSNFWLLQQQYFCNLKNGNSNPVFLLCSNVQVIHSVHLCNFVCSSNQTFSYALLSKTAVTLWPLIPFESPNLLPYYVSLKKTKNKRPANPPHLVWSFKLLISSQWFLFSILFAFGRICPMVISSNV